MGTSRSSDKHWFLPPDLLVGNYEAIVAFLGHVYGCRIYRENFTLGRIFVSVVVNFNLCVSRGIFCPVRGHAIVLRSLQATLFYLPF